MSSRQARRARIVSVVLGGIGALLLLFGCHALQPYWITHGRPTARFSIRVTVGGDQNQYLTNIPEEVGTYRWIPTENGGAGAYEFATGSIIYRIYQIDDGSNWECGPGGRHWIFDKGFGPAETAIDDEYYSCYGLGALPSGYSNDWDSSTMSLDLSKAGIRNASSEDGPYGKVYAGSTLAVTDFDYYDAGGEAPAGGSTGSPTYQWQIATDPVTIVFADIPGATASTYTPTSDQQTRWIRCVVTVHSVSGRSGSMPTQPVLVLGPS